MGNQNNKEKLHQHQEENKYNDVNEMGKRVSFQTRSKRQESITYNPFDEKRQERIIDLYEREIKPNHNSTLTSNQLVKWLSTYISEERYRSDEAIQEDLHDPQYSHLKEAMENDLQNDVDENTVNAIYDALKSDIFTNNEQINYNSTTEYSTTSNVSEYDPPTARSSVIIKNNDDDDDDNNKISKAQERVESDIMFGGTVGLIKQKTVGNEEEIQLEDDYGANKESMPEFINVALFGRSDDEYLEMLIDSAIDQVCYGSKLNDLWRDKSFIEHIYNNKRFPQAVEDLYNKINHDDVVEDLDFIGDFVSKEFKRQINENKRRIEEQAIENLEDQIQENLSHDFDEKYENIYNVYIQKNDQDALIDEYVIRKKHQGEKIQHKKRRKLKDADHPLFQLQPQENDNDDFCWAVFKKKKYRNHYGIKTKGRWEIITEQDDKKRIEDARKLESMSSPNVFASLLDDIAGKSGKNLLKSTMNKTKRVGKKIMKSTRNLANADIEDLKDEEEEEKNPTTTIVPTTSLKSVQSTHSNIGSPTGGGGGGGKKNKFKYMPLEHLNVLFELLQYHYWHSIKEIKEKKSIESKNGKLVSTPMYHDYCALSPDLEDNISQKTMLRKETSYRIIINGKTYKLCWWNMKGRGECNAISIEYENRKYYYLRFRHRYEKISEESGKAISRMIWDWYDNDAARYRKYNPGINNKVYKELEASFQANVDSNFPRIVFDPESKNPRMFNICILDELKKYLKKYKNVDVECMVLRFTFTDKTNRILNIEQVSLRKNGSFPRNVRRVLDQKNSLNSYWQNTNKFIEEWKYRYLLSTKQQQLYFWSYILSIAAIMKYIEIETQYQMISIPFETTTKKEDVEYTGLDDSDLQRHKIDYQLWNGFFMPPMNQLQTAQISKNMSVTDDFEDWYSSLSRVEPLTKFINHDINNKNKKKNKKLYNNINNIACKHKVKNDQILWYSKKTYEVYCDKCATLLQFAECLRKYVLETDSHEVVDFMWPWYRNYFHQYDRKKYLKYIAKYNLSHLFLPRDVLRHLLSNDNHNKQDIENDDDDDDDDDNDDDQDEKEKNNKKRNKCCGKCCIWSCCCCNDDDQDDKTEKRIRQIRHARKFAAHVLLGPWDILRNLNVIKSQLQLLFRFISDKRENTPSNQQDNDNEKYLYETWEEWNIQINTANKEAIKQIQESNRKTILELRHETTNEFDDDQQNILHSLIEAIFKDIEENQEPEHDISDEQMRYYTEFRESFHRTPSWWVIEHDILLIELSLKFNWNKDEINHELTDESKKLYYQELLKNTQKQQKTDNNNHYDDYNQDYHDKMEEKEISQDGSIHTDDDDDDDGTSDDNEDKEKKEEEIKYNNNNNNNNNNEDIHDDFEYRGYQEFQVWCNDWRNIQHRLRYLSFIVCKKLDECEPSIVEIRIPNPNDRIKQYESKSFVFLNGYIEKTHIENCKIKEKHLSQILSKSRQIKSLGNLSQRILHKAQESKIIDREKSSSRMRDPFLTRHLDFELEQICQSFDLLKHGVDIAIFLIKLLARKQSESLWSALGIVLEYMPYEKARYVLSEEREDLRHGSPDQLKMVCDRIVRGSSFSVHICLFLAEYMENNANQDLARFDKWKEFSIEYEAEAGETINEIESDHLLSVLMDIPLSGSGSVKVPLLQVALEQNRAKFLNNERINAVLKHVWQTPSGLAPNVEILRKPRTSTEILKLLCNSPYHFYLTPAGFNATIKSLHLIYVLLIFIFITQRIYLPDKLKYPEMALWTLNIGYFVYEMIEAYDKGLRDYFTLAGWVNYWDLQISFTWLILFGIRIWSVIENYENFYKDEITTSSSENDTPSPTENPNTYLGRWHIAQCYLVLWAIQTASLSGRSLVLFQTSEYFGVLLRMMQRLIIEMTRFMFVLVLVLVGFVFGLYYIQGGYLESEPSTDDWYKGFKYLFQLTVGVGDFSDIETDIVENEITAQLFTILYIIFGTILMINLLIALLVATFDNVYKQARTESSFAIAETTYDLSHRSRFMPAPICIYVFAFAVIIHVLNFFPAILWPKVLNIYVYVNHHRYENLVAFKCSDFCCGRGKKNKRNDDDNDDKNIGFELKLNNNNNNNNNRNVNNNNNDKDDEVEDDEYKLVTRGRIWKYYASTLFVLDSCTPKWIERWLSGYRFNIHHTGCYSCIPTKLGAKIRAKDKDRSTCNGITLNQYAEEYEQFHKFALDPQDTVLLKHLTIDTLFCRICYKPFDPTKEKNLEDILLTPFWALSEIISIYIFPFTVWIFLVLAYGLAAAFEKIGSWFDDDDADQQPMVLDHDRHFWYQDTLNLSKNTK